MHRFISDVFCKRYCFIRKGVKVVKISIFYDGETSLLFEDSEFPVPEGYHEYLTINYGDYMADLPEELQKGHDLTLGDIEGKV